MEWWETDDYSLEPVDEISKDTVQNSWDKRVTQNMFNPSKLLIKNQVSGKKSASGNMKTMGNYHDRLGTRGMLSNKNVAKMAAGAAAVYGAKKGIGAAAKYVSKKIKERRKANGDNSDAVQNTQSGHREIYLNHLHNDHRVAEIAEAYFSEFKDADLI